MIFKNKTSTLSFLFGAFICVSFLKAEAIVVRKIASNKRLVLADSVERDLFAKYPDYRFMTEDDSFREVNRLFDTAEMASRVPYALISDFNNDGKNDVLVLLIKKDKTKQMLVAILSKDAAYEVSWVFTGEAEPDQKSFLFLDSIPRRNVVFKRVTLGRSVRPQDVVKLDVWGAPRPIIYACHKNNRMINCNSHIERFDFSDVNNP